MNTDFMRAGLLPGRVLKSEAALIIKKGVAYISHEHASLSTPTDIADCVVPARRFLEGLARTPDAEVRVTPKRVTITNAQKSFRIQRMEEQSPAFRPLDSDGAQAVPDGLRQAFSQLIPFCSDEVSRPWTLGVREHAGRFMSTNGLVLAVSSNEFESPFNGMTLPNLFARILSTSPVTLFDVRDDHFVGWLDDGSSARVTALANAMPDKVPQLYNSVYSEPSWMIPNEWRDIFSDALRSMDTRVTVEAERIVADILNDQVIGYASSGATGSIFHPRLLSKVLAVSEYIDFSAYPKPVPFKGDHVCGLLAGMT